MIAKTVCVFCGAENPETKDHIPPKSLFAKPYPNDMITVPCCEVCRSGWSDDDEYFRTILLTSENMDFDSRVLSALSSVYRSVRKPGKVAFARMISDSICDFEVRTPTGIVLPTKSGFKYDAPRISRVLSRIVKGLFSHEFGVVFPSDYEVWAILDQYGQKAQEITKAVRFEDARWAADRMFVYTFARAEDSEWASIWLGAFYEKVSFVAFVRPTKLEGKTSRTL